MSKYLGEHLFTCRLSPYDWQNANAMIVSGYGINKCGYALLQVGKDYFHIDGPVERPWRLSYPGFHRYMKENEKRLLRKVSLDIKNPQAAQDMLEQLTSTTWTWGVVMHNCATFVEKVANAGGARLNISMNCPALGPS